MSKQNEFTVKFGCLYLTQDMEAQHGARGTRYDTKRDRKFTHSAATIRLVAIHGETSQSTYLIRGMSSHKIATKWNMLALFEKNLVP